MKKGLILLKSPTMTLEMRAFIGDLLEKAGFTIEHRQRFDGALAVAFEKAEPIEMTKDELDAKLRENAVVSDAAFDVKVIE